MPFCFKKSNKIEPTSQQEERKKEFIEEMNVSTKKKLTFFFVALIFLSMILIYFSSGNIVEMKYTYQMEGNVLEESFHYFDFLYVLQWVVVVLLVAILWMWRKFFGIEGFGPVQGKSESKDSTPKIETNPSDQLADSKLEEKPEKVDQEEVSEKNDQEENAEKVDQEANSQEKMTPSMTEKKMSSQKRRGVRLFKKSKQGLQNAKKLSRIKKGDASISISVDDTQETSEKETNKTLIPDVERYRQILNSLFEKYKTVSIEKISKELNLNVKASLNVLNLMPEVYRIDGKGGCSVVSKQESPENVVLNYLFYLYNTDGSLSQFRVARVNNSNIDAVFLSESEVYLISLMNVMKSAETNSVCKEMGRLFKVSKKFKSRKAHLIISFLGKNDMVDARNTRSSILNRCRNISADMQIKFIDPEKIGFGDRDPYTSRSAE